MVEPFFAKYKWQTGEINIGRIILPESALCASIRSCCQKKHHHPGPLIFRIYNEISGRTSHSAAQSFTANEGTIVVPQWMLDNLDVQENEELFVQRACLPFATSYKVESIDTRTIRVDHQRDLIINSINKLCCLTIGDKITIDRNNGPSFQIVVLKTDPDDAVNITACEIETIETSFILKSECTTIGDSFPKAIPFLEIDTEKGLETGDESDTLTLKSEGIQTQQPDEKSEVVEFVNKTSIISTKPSKSESLTKHMNAELPKSSKEDEHIKDLPKTASETSKRSDISSDDSTETEQKKSKSAWKCEIKFFKNLKQKLKKKYARKESVDDKDENQTSNCEREEEYKHYTTKQIDSDYINRERL